MSGGHTPFMYFICYICFSCGESLASSEAQEQTTTETSQHVERKELLPEKVNIQVFFCFHSIYVMF